MLFPGEDAILYAWVEPEERNAATRSVSESGLNGGAEVWISGDTIHISVLAEMR